MSGNPASADLGSGIAILCADREARWRQGDWLIERMAGLTSAEAAKVKADAARATATDLRDLSRLAAVAQAFGLDRRRLALSFEHHEAVMKLATDTERDAMLTEAQANGWTAKQTRAAVLNLRVATGAYLPPDDDDPEDALFRAAAQACNRANPNVRRMLVESLEEANFGVIAL